MTSNVSIKPLHAMQVLHVAILVRNEAAVQALLDFGLDSACRNARRWTALDEAIATRHRSITKLLYTHAYASKKARMKEKKMQLMETCNELPNYTVKVFQTCSTCINCRAALHVCCAAPFVYTTCCTANPAGALACVHAYLLNMSNPFLPVLPSPAHRYTVWHPVYFAELHILAVKVECIMAQRNA